MRLFIKRRLFKFCTGSFMLILALFSSYCTVHGYSGNGKNPNTLNKESNEILGKKTKRADYRTSKKQKNKNLKLEDNKEKKSEVKNENFDYDKSKINKKKNDFFLNRLLNSGDDESIFENENFESKKLENTEKNKLNNEKMKTSKGIMDSYFEYCENFYNDCMKKDCLDKSLSLTFTNRNGLFGNSSESYPEVQDFEIKFSPTFFLDMCSKAHVSRKIDIRKINFDITDVSGFIVKGNLEGCKMQAPEDERFAGKMLGKVELKQCTLCAKGDFIKFVVETNRLLNINDVSGVECGECFKLENGKPCRVKVYYGNELIFVSDVQAKRREIADCLNLSEEDLFSEFKHLKNFNKKFWRKFLKSHGISEESGLLDLESLLLDYENNFKKGEIEVIN